MKNSIYQDTAMSVAFYDNKVFKSVDELTEYLKLSHKLTDAGVEAVLSQLPRIGRTVMMSYLEEAKLTSPKRCAKIQAAVTNRTIVEGCIVDHELQNFWMSPDEPKRVQTEEPAKPSKKKKKKKH